MRSLEEVYAALGIDPPPDGLRTPPQFVAAISSTTSGEVVTVRYGGKHHFEIYVAYGTIASIVDGSPQYFSGPPSTYPKAIYDLVMCLREDAGDRRMREGAAALNVPNAAIENYVEAVRSIGNAVPRRSWRR